MTCKSMTLISSAVLALAMTGPAVAADVTGAATDAVKKKTAEEVQKQVPGAVTTPAVDPTKAVKGAVTTPAVDPTKAVKGAAAVPAVDPAKAATDAAKDKAGTMLPKTGAAAAPGAAAVPGAAATKAATETAEDLAKKKVTEAAQGVVK